MVRQLARVSTKVAVAGIAAGIIAFVVIVIKPLAEVAIAAYDDYHQQKRQVSRQR